MLSEPLMAAGADNDFQIADSDNDEKASLKASGSPTGPNCIVYSSYGSTNNHHYNLSTSNTKNQQKAHKEAVTSNDDEPPSFTRRMSSQFLGTLDRQSSVTGLDSMANYIPDAVANYIPGLNRQQTGKLTNTYFCNICFTKYPISEGFTLSNCTHRFCTPCLQGFLANKINDGHVKLNCFYPDKAGGKPCGVTVSEDDIRAIVSVDTWNKYNKFKSNLENTLSRQCPFCDTTQIGDANIPVMRCNNPSCNKSYCLYHSNAHPISETCESYELRTAKENKMNEMAINELGDDVKPCPQCNFRILKNGGCNHMKCVKCGCSFCWLCMEIIEDTELPRHYKDEESGCKGKQFEGMDMDPPSKWAMALLCICTVIFCLPATALGITCGILCYPLVLCCGCFKHDNGNNQNIFETMFGCWFFWIFIFILIAVLIPVIVLIIIWEVISAIWEIFRICLPCLPRCPRRRAQPLQAQVAAHQQQQAFNATTTQQRQ